MEVSLKGAQLILNAGDTPRECSLEERVYVEECLLKHPQAKGKVGGGITSIWIKKARFGSRGFYVTRADGTEIDFSIYKCFRPSISKNSALFAAAARTASFDGAVSGHHKHHLPPWTFAKILREFITVEKIDMDKVDFDHSGLGVTFADTELSGRFKKFHDALAVIEVILPEEHKKRHLTSGRLDATLT